MYTFKETNKIIYTSYIIHIFKNEECPTKYRTFFKSQKHIQRDFNLMRELFHFATQHKYI